MKVYQIGVGDFGRYGFEKLVEMHNHLEEVNVELTGICDRDPSQREDVEKFAKANNIDLKTFKSVDELYRDADKYEEVLIYDAGPSQTHADNIYKSMRYGFFHIAEKPPSMKREQHIQEKKLAETNQVFWKADFIERQSPVVIKALELLENEEIESIEIFRESSIGAQKTLEPHRLGVRGGDILDKMSHEVYLLDFLERTGNELEISLDAAKTRYYQLKNEKSDAFMNIEGGKTTEINENIATAMTTAKFSSGNVEISLNSSWLGASDRAINISRTIEERTGHQVINEDHQEAGNQVFLNQENRFFVIRGSKDLVGDMLNQKLFNLETGEKIELPSTMHDQLYRVLENSIKSAAGLEERNISAKETDIFMNALFDVRDSAIDEHDDEYTEMEKARDKLRELIFRIDTKESEVEA